MSDQITVTMISGGIALLVALLGIGGAIAAQLVATRRAFENSLALFERQAAEAQQARDEAARIQNRHRFADQKRSTYGRALRLADELVGAREEERLANRNFERTKRVLERVGDQSDALAKTVDDFRNSASEQHDRVRRLAVELADVVGEIQLLSDNTVRSAADRLRKSAQTASHVEESRYVEDRDAFLLAARNELDVEPA
ncbi:hypothetical protein [Actinophytocola sp.]|uniref:hypothetical protein n=1 Tax=Actinophytocola sp. TaxID=1872138 RepID=UPI002ED6A068